MRFGSSVERDMVCIYSSGEDRTSRFSNNVLLKDVNNFFYRIVTTLEDETAPIESFPSILPAVYIIPLDRRGARG